MRNSYGDLKCVSVPFAQLPYPTVVQKKTFQNIVWFYYSIYVFLTKKLMTFSFNVVITFSGDCPGMISPRTNCPRFSVNLFYIFGNKARLSNN